MLDFVVAGEVHHRNIHEHLFAFPDRNPMLRARRCRHDDRDLSHRPHCSRRGRGWWRHRFLGVSPACRRRRRHRRLECRGRRSRRHPGRGRTARTTVRISCRRRPRPRDAAFDDREPSRGRPRRQRRRRGHGAVLAPTARLPHRVFRSSPHHQPSIRLHELPDRCRSTDRRCSPGGDGEHLLDRLERAAPPRWLRRRKGGSRFTHSIHGDGVGSPWHPGQQCRTRHRQHPRSGRPVDDPDDPLAKGITLGRRGTPTDIANACVYLLSDLAGYVTGQTLDVDGGPSRGALDEHDLPVFVTNPAIRARFES